jgi:hypothetical protein
MVNDDNAAEHDGNIVRFRIGADGIAMVEDDVVRDMTAVARGDLLAVCHACRVPV